MNDGVGLLNDVEEMNLWGGLRVCNWNGLDSEINSVVAMLGDQMLQKNIGDFDDVVWGVGFLRELEMK